MAKKEVNKEAKLQVRERLHQSLPGLIELLGEKEFEKRIKKAAKLLVAGIEMPAKKKKFKEPKVTIKAA